MANLPLQLFKSFNILNKQNIKKMSFASELKYQSGKEKNIVSYFQHRNISRLI